jgi:hypothetical protein
MLPESLHCLFLITTSIFPDVYCLAVGLYSLLCCNVKEIPLRIEVGSLRRVGHGNDVGSREPVSANADVSW